MNYSKKTAQPARVFVIDDIAIHLALLRAILEQRGHTVIASTSGAEALDLVRESTPSIFLIDIHMPDMDGFTFIEEMRRRELAPNVPFVFITADDKPSFRTRATALGAADYLLKPIDPETVLQHIEAALSPGAAKPATGPGNGHGESAGFTVGRRSAIGVMEGAWRLTLPEDMLSGGRLETVSAIELLKRATARVSAKATERGINLLIDQVPALNLTCHPELLTRTVTTLLEAAVVRGEPGGSIRVRVESTPTGLRIRIGVPCPSNEAAALLQTAQSGPAGIRVEPGETGGVLLIADLRAESRG